MTLMSPHRLSTLIGAIYDCAIDPERWPRAMREICVDLRCVGSVIVLADSQQARPRFLKAWNYDVDRILHDQGYVEDIMFFLRQAPMTTLALDEPAATSRLFSYIPAFATRYGKEVAQPHGYIDALQVVVARDSHRFGLFATLRHESAGFVSDDDIAILRLLAPHIRRAITISDLMDLKSLEANALAATLDRLAVGVVVVAGENRILHANEAARQMFADGGSVVSRQGRLSVRDAAAEQVLRRAIDAARRKEAMIGAAGIGVALGSPGAEPVVAHVLPLASGDLRTRLMPQAIAAVFIVGPENGSSLDIGPLTRSYGLTPAEVRVLERLLTGATLGDVAETLDISQTTVKTHLSRIFSKTGVARQSDLVALFHRMTPQVR